MLTAPSLTNAANRRQNLLTMIYEFLILHQMVAVSSGLCQGSPKPSCNLVVFLRAQIAGAMPCHFMIDVTRHHTPSILAERLGAFNDNRISTLGDKCEHHESPVQLISHALLEAGSVQRTASSA